MGCLSGAVDHVNIPTPEQQHVPLASARGKSTRGHAMNNACQTRNITIDVS